MRYGSAEIDLTSAARNNGYVALDTPVVDTWPFEPPIRRAERAFGVRFELGVGAAARAG